MKRAAAWNVRGVEKSTRALAEEAARRAGMPVADWLDEVVAEQAASQGVAADDISVDDDQDESRPATSDSAPPLATHGMRRRPGPPERDETGLAKPEKTPAPDDAEDLDRRLEALARRAAGKRAVAAATPPALEAPTDVDPAFAALRAEIIKLNARLAGPAAKGKLEPLPKPEVPAERPALSPAQRPLTRDEAEALREDAAAMRRSLADLDQRSALLALESAMRDLADRFEATRRQSGNVAALKPIEDKLDAWLAALPRLNPQTAAQGVARGLKALTDRIDALARSSLAPDSISEIRSENEDIRRQLADAASKAAPLTRTERDIERIAARVERLSAHPFPQAEIERLARSLDLTRTQVERASLPSALAAIAERLNALTGRIDEALRRAEKPQDTRSRDGNRPGDDLARRIDSVRGAIEQRGGDSAQARKIDSALASLSGKLDGKEINAELNATLQQLLTRIEALPRATAAATAERPQDPAPFQDLARRIDALHGALEQRGPDAGQTRKLETALAALAAKLEGRETNAELNATLQQLLTRIEALPRAAAAAAAERPHDPAPFQDLARRIDAMRSALEQRGDDSAQARKLEAALSDLSRKFDALAKTSAANDELAAMLKHLLERLDDVAASQRGFDHSALEALGQRIESLRGASDARGEGIAGARRIENAISDLGRRFDQIAASTSSNYALNETLERLLLRLEDQAEREGAESGPLNDLTDRVEALRAAIQERAQPANDRLEAALAELSDRLDEPLRRNDERLHAALATLTARVETLATQPDPARLEGRIVDLAYRIDGVRAELEQHGDVAALAERMETALEDLRHHLDQSLSAANASPSLTATLQLLVERLDDLEARPAPAPFDPSRIEDLAHRIDDLRAAIEAPAGLRRLEVQFAELNAKFDDRLSDSPALETVNHNLQRLMARLEAAANGPASTAPTDKRALADEIGALTSAIERQGDVRPQLAALAAGLSDVRHRLDAVGFGQTEAKALLDVVAELAERLDNPPPAPDLAPLQAAIDNLSERASGFHPASIQAMLNDVAERIESGAKLDLQALSQWMTRLDERLKAVDPQPIEEAIRDLEDRIAARPPGGLSADEIEKAADLIAGRLNARAPFSAEADPLFEQIGDIQQRLDSLGGVAESNAALEKTIGELMSEFETTRTVMLAAQAARSDGGHSVVDNLAELRTEQAAADRRMAARLGRVQEILEQLNDRLRQLEDDRERPATPRAAPAVAKVDLADIPDRPIGFTPPPTLVKPAAPEASFLLEPGSAAPTPRPAEPEKTSDLQAHIAAARRAAMAEIQAKRSKTAASPLPEINAKRDRVQAPAAEAFESDAASDPAAKAAAGGRRLPILVGALVVLAAATTAMYEWRSGPAVAPPARTQTAPAPTLSPSAHIDDKSGVDYRPTGSIDPAPAPASSPKPALPAVAAKIPADLVASIPDGQPDALRIAAINGDIGAETEMALRFLEGRTLTRDAKLAARWFELAANQGSPFAQYRLGALYEKGVGATRDVPLARAWYGKAAAAGNARAMHNLAVLNAEDAGAGKPDYALAAQGFKDAAEFGVRDSQFNLGVLYGRGLGVPQDLGQSWLWFALAAQQGDGDAAKKRDEVAAKMDAKALAAATKMLADFKLKTPAPAANDPPPPPAGGWEGKSRTSAATTPAKI